MYIKVRHGGSQTAMLLKEILDSIDVEKVARFRDLDIKDLCYDSRLVQPGQAFFCIKGW